MLLRPNVTRPNVTRRKCTRRNVTEPFKVVFNQRDFNKKSMIMFKYTT